MCKINVFFIKYYVEFKYWNKKILATSENKHKML